MSLINLKSKDMYDEPINLWRTKQRVHYHHDVISKGNELVSHSNSQLQWHIYTASFGYKRSQDKAICTRLADSRLFHSKYFGVLYLITVVRQTPIDVVL